MSISVEKFEEILNSNSETKILEFKEAKSSFDDDNLCKYCTGIANCGGGYLILGVTDKYPRTVVGSPWPSDPVKKEKQIFDRLKFKVEISTIEYNGKRVVIFEIPSRPTGSPYSYAGCYYTRIGESLEIMPTDELKRICSEGRAKWTSLVAKSECNDSDIIELLDTQIYFQLLKNPYPSERGAVLDKFQQESLILKRKNSWSITNLGAILFAKSIDSFPDLKFKMPRFIVYKDKTRLQTVLDISGVKGYVVGFEGLMDYINARIPRNEIISTAFRKEIQMFPKLSMRELVANALIHQDFEISGASVKIELFSDRLEISNLGVPKVAVERFVDECNSRNEALASLMRRLGICEEKGSGIDKVISETEIYQLPAPLIRSENSYTKVTLFAHIPFKNMSREERVRACYMHACLKYASNEKMNNHSLRKRFGLGEKQVSVVSCIIKEALEKGVIKVDDENKDSTKHRTYRPSWA